MKGGSAKVEIFGIDVFHGFYRTAIVPTFIDVVPFLINIVASYSLFPSKKHNQGIKMQCL